VLAFRILLDNRRVVSWWAKIGPQLELILLFLMVVQLAHDALLMVVILAILNVVFLVAVVVFLGLRYLGMPLDCLRWGSLLFGGPPLPELLVRGGVHEDVIEGKAFVGAPAKEVVQLLFEGRICCGGVTATRVGILNVLETQTHWLDR
jgi:hypothetical protein